jgi:hypothetical protein
LLHKVLLQYARLLWAAAAVADLSGLQVAAVAAVSAGKIISPSFQDKAIRLLLALAVLVLNMLQIILQTEVPVISITYQLLLDMVAVTADLIQEVQIQVMAEDLWEMAVVAVVMPLIKELGILLVLVQVVIGEAAETQVNHQTVLLLQLDPVQALQADGGLQIMVRLLEVVSAYTALAQTVLRVVNILEAAAVQVVPTALAAKVPVNLQVERMEPLLAAVSVEAAAVPVTTMAAEMVVAELCALYGVPQRHFLHLRNKSTPTPHMNLVRLQLTTTMEPFLLAISQLIHPRLTWQLLERTL